MIRLPHFITIGAMKCGTSTLHEQLAAQPGIFMSNPKEPNYFSDDVNYERGLDWYRALFAQAAPDDLCGESSTHYTKLPTYPNTVARMGELLRGVKLIYVMRHPVERLISHYVHEWTMRVIDEPIEQALVNHPELVAYSCYARQLEPYFKEFGPESVLPVFAERMRAQPQTELERVCRFIGYPGSPTWSDSMDAQNVSSERLRQCGWRDALVDAPILRQIRQYAIPQSVRDRIKQLWQMRDRPKLSATTKAHLQEVFDEDLASLSDWLGQRLTCASYHDLVTGAKREPETRTGADSSVQPIELP